MGSNQSKPTIASSQGKPSPARRGSNTKRDNDSLAFMPQTPSQSEVRQSPSQNCTTAHGMKDPTSVTPTVSNARLTPAGSAETSSTEGGQSFSRNTSTRSSAPLPERSSHFLFDSGYQSYQSNWGLSSNLFAHNDPTSSNVPTTPEASWQPVAELADVTDETEKWWTVVSLVNSIATSPTLYASSPTGHTDTIPPSYGRSARKASLDETLCIRDGQAPLKSSWTRIFRKPTFSSIDRSSQLDALFAKACRSDNPQDRSVAFQAAFACSQQDDVTAKIWVAECYLEGFGVEANPSRGWNELKALAEANHWQAYCPLARHYLLGVKDTKRGREIQAINASAARQWYEAAAQLNVTRETKDTVGFAQAALGCLLAQTKDFAKESDQIIPWFTKSAHNGNCAGQLMVGFCYELGVISPESTGTDPFATAKQYFQNSASQGCAAAQAALGMGLIKEKNYVEGIQLLEQAASQGDARALLKLGLLYEEGLHVKQNNQTALDYYEKAAMNENAIAQYRLATIYCFGQLGQEKNQQRCLNYLRRSAKAGYSESQRLLGLHLLLAYRIDCNHANGRRSKSVRMRQQSQEAINWLKRSAAQHNVRALIDVGSCYEQGNSVTVDYKLALELYQKAASMETPFKTRAQVCVGQLLVTMKQAAEAYEWFKRAAESAQTYHTDALSKKEHQLYQYLSMSSEWPVRRARFWLVKYQLNGWGNVPKNQKLAFEMLTQLAKESEHDTETHHLLATCYEIGLAGVCDRNPEIAYTHFRLAAENGLPDAQFKVAMALASGAGVGMNKTEAFEWFKKSAQLGHPSAMYHTGLYYYHGHAPASLDFARANAYIERAADRGHVRAMTWLGTMHQNKTASTPAIRQFHLERAANWFSRAANTGDSIAQRELAKMYDKGLAVEQSYTQAFRYLSLAAEQQDKEAIFYMAKYYLHGHAVPKDVDRAIELYLKAGRLGKPIAFYEAAQAYHHQGKFDQAFLQYQIAARLPELADTIEGNLSRLMYARYVLSYVPSCPENTEDTNDRDDVNVGGQDLNLFSITELQNVTRSEAFEILRHLATNDEFAQSFYWLADAYFYGKGVATNYKEAALWYQRSAEETHNTDAMVQLANMYEHGIGVDANLQRAFSLYSKSAELNHAMGQYELGMAYLYGKFNTAIEIDRAKQWLSAAAAQSHGPSLWTLGQLCLEACEMDKAMAWWDKAIKDADHVPSMRSLGELVLQIAHTRPDQEACTNYALKLLHKAAQMHDVESAFILGRYYLLSSIAIEKTIREHEISDLDVTDLVELQQEHAFLALQSFQEAANGGHVGAMYNMAEILLTEDNVEKALYYYKCAAEQNHAASRVMVARLKLVGCDGMEADPVQGFQELYACAKEKCVNAYNTLAQCYELGLGTEQYDAMALHWYSVAAQASRDPEALCSMGRLYAEGRGGIGPNEVTTSKDLLALHCYQLAYMTSNHPVAHYRAGLYYLYGITDQGRVHLESQPRTARIHFQKSAEQGNVDAMYKLGQLLLSDMDTFTAQDQKEGFDWLWSAVNLMSRKAQRTLGQFYLEGKLYKGSSDMWVIPKDPAVSFQLLYDAAAQHDKVAALYLGYFYERGIHVPTDLVLAETWYKNAILYSTQHRHHHNSNTYPSFTDKDTESDSSSDTETEDDITTHRTTKPWWLAEFALASLLNKNPSRQAEAYHIYKSCYNHAGAKQRSSPGIMIALYNLHGWGNRPVDAERAAEQLIQYAKAGEQRAYLQVAQCYESGLGVTSNISQAYFWYNALYTYYENLSRDSHENIDEELRQQVAIAVYKLAEFNQTGSAGVVDHEKAAYFSKLATRILYNDTTAAVIKAKTTRR